MSNKKTSPLRHYSSLRRFSDMEYFEKENIDFGKSNTDQSFYEPTQTLIANAERSGQLVVSSRSADNLKLSDEKLFESALYTSGMTMEESTQFENDLRGTLEVNQRKLQENVSKVVEDIVQNEIKKE